jgi:hypothetical protein
MPRHHVLGDPVLVLAASAAVADDRKANGCRLLSRQGGDAEKADEAKETADASPSGATRYGQSTHATMLARPGSHFNTALPGALHFLFAGRTLEG